MVNIARSASNRLGWRVQPVFSIILNKKDIGVLEQIKVFFGVGSIYSHGSRVQYSVRTLNELSRIINHFDKYPLITQKQADYLLFREVFLMLEGKEHLTTQGIAKIVALKASLNKGLSDELKVAFPNIIPASRLIIKNSKISDPNWLAGFASGEGSFNISIRKSKTHSSGYQVHLKFTITQHWRDEQLLRSLVDYLDCGKVYKDGETFQYQVQKFTDHTENIIPFFSKYLIIGVKALDFQDWCKACEIVKLKDHLTDEGISKISTIKMGMNKGRL